MVHRDHLRTQNNFNKFCFCRKHDLLKNKRETTTELANAKQWKTVNTLITAN